MTIDFLKWDSNFFKKKIAVVDVVFDNNEASVISTIAANEGDYDLVYIKTPGDYFLSEAVLSGKNIRLVDSKIVYEKPIEKDAMASDNRIFVYDEKAVCPDLVSLAFQSGKYSRYKLDENFEKGTFERLYTQWIENSVNGSFADAMFVYKEKDRILGMLTTVLDETKKLATIQLIAVDESVQGKGIGSALINEEKIYLIKHDIHKVEVATQVDNKQACFFYEKNGFKVKSITNIYHYWLK